jgi:hypothetical protein
MIKPVRGGQSYRFRNGLAVAVLPDASGATATLAVFYYRNDRPLGFGPLDADQVAESLAGIQRIPLFAELFRTQLAADPPEFPHDQPSATWLGSMTMPADSPSAYERMEMWWYDGDVTIRSGPCRGESFRGASNPKHPAVTLANVRARMFYGC